VGGAVFFGDGSVVATAGGSGESAADAMASEGNAVSQTRSGADGPSASRDVLRAELETAIELAGRTPDEWDYDPADRTIHAEDAELGYPLELPQAEWRELLDPDAYSILRQKGTEPAFTHPLNDNKEAGIYYSKATGQPLFSSDDKYDSGTGWPSFTKPINPHAIVYVEDNSLFARRIEVVDSLSGSHLGHVFSDGPEPTGQRYCINGAALVFVPDGEEPPPIRTR
ncbi:MAG: peptide-methionine (R)-S-oxide reductase MsrB, partial [Spirochaetota bacterium]